MFFFDEAHLLFDDAPKALLDNIERVVRLIRSKGVGIYFITQNPIDVPDTILGQLGNRSIFSKALSRSIDFSYRPYNFDFLIIDVRSSSVMAPIWLSGECFRRLC